MRLSDVIVIIQDKALQHSSLSNSNQLANSPSIGAKKTKGVDITIPKDNSPKGNILVLVANLVLSISQQRQAAGIQYLPF